VKTLSKKAFGKGKIGIIKVEKEMNFNNRLLLESKCFTFSRSKALTILTATFLFLFFITVDSSLGFSSKKLPRVEIIKVSIGNLRARPMINSSIVDKLRRGDKVTLMHQKGEWYIVKLSDDRLGWAHQCLFLEKGVTPESKKTALKKIESGAPSYVAPSRPSPEIEETVTLKVGIGRVREGPSLDSKIKFRLKKGEAVSVIEKKHAWYHVELDDGRTGWAHQSLFLKSNQTQVASTGIVKEVKEIRVEVTPEGEEKVFFELSGFYPPQMMAIEGERPRVVCDFYGVRLGSNIARRIEVNGNLIQQIRIAHHEGLRPRVRIVLDLVPHKNYNVQQVFFKKEHLYTLIISPTHEPPTKM